MSDAEQIQIQRLEIEVMDAPNIFREDLARGFLRYETVRRMNAAQFAEIFRENLATGIAFDELIDRELLKWKGKTK